MTQNLEAFDHKTVLITGGLGFIGSNLAMRLAESSRAIITDHSPGFMKSWAGSRR